MSNRYRDASLSPEERTEDLLAQMTLDEKLAQLQCHFYAHGDLQKDTRYGIGQVSTLEFRQALSLEEAAGIQREIQETVMNNSRFGIPAVLHMEGLCGALVQDATSFPAGIGRGASFDPALEEKISEIVSRQERALGITQILAPVLDINREPRMGREGETYGEDSTLAAAMGSAYTRGIQKQGDGECRAESVAKHYMGFHQSEGGVHGTVCSIPERLLREVYGLPFQAAIAEENLRGVMPCYCSIGGEPVSASERLLTQILRQEMGFDGVLISDYAAILETVAHGASSDKKDAAHKALLAGVDIDMMTGCYAGELAKLVKEGTIPESLIDESVLRILQLKNQLGLFEHPHKDADPEKEARYILCPEHRALAREAAAASCVLLKNDKVLPIRPSQKVAFIGPYIDNYEICSSWAVTGHPEDSVTIRQAAKELLPDSDLTFCHGTTLLPRDHVFAGFAEPNRAEEFYADVFADPEKALADAVAAAKAADVVILCLGEHYLQTGEATSRTELSLPENQMELFCAVKTVNPNVAVVLFNGHPLLLDELSRNAAAILQAWLPGTEGGHAILDLLTGTKNPSGKLPMTFPRNMGQIPIYYNHFSTGRPLTGTDPQRFVSKYTDTPNTPLFPFGYGLSYAEFSYSDVSLSSDSLTSEDSITASVQLKNTGACTGTEVVQLYIQDVAASTVRPVRELKGFTRITLTPGETQTVSFRISEAELSFHRADGSYGTEPGAFRVWIGGSSATENGTGFTLR